MPQPSHDPILDSSFDIRIIAAHETHPLRQQVLRPHQALEEMVYPGDEAPQTIHLGLYIQGDLRGILSLYNQPMPEQQMPGDWRFRGMAIDPDCQAQGLGTKLLAAGSAVAKTAGAKRLWCNARTSATGFYKSQDFTQTGPPFDIPGIGEHFVMWIELLS